VPYNLVDFVRPERIVVVCKEVLQIQRHCQVQHRRQVVVVAAAVVVVVLDVVVMVFVVRGFALVELKMLSYLSV